LDGNGTLICVIDTGPLQTLIHTPYAPLAAVLADGSVLTTGLSRLAAKYPDLDGNGKLICVVDTGPLQTLIHTPYAPFAAVLADGSVLTTGLSRLAAKYPDLDGNGKLICVVDTGLQYRLPAFGSCLTDITCCTLPCAVLSLLLHSAQMDLCLLPACPD
jgi:hypothetical protein